MCVFFVYILPIILTIVLFILYRIIVKNKEDIPRILRWIFFLMTLIPILGLLLCIAYWFIFIYMVLGDALELKEDSKLANYLFKS